MPLLSWLHPLQFVHWYVPPSPGFTLYSMCINMCSSSPGFTLYSLYIDVYFTLYSLIYIGKSLLMHGPQRHTLFSVLFSDSTEAALSIFSSLIIMIMSLGVCTSFCLGSWGVPTRLYHIIFHIYTLLQSVIVRMLISQCYHCYQIL